MRSKTQVDFWLWLPNLVIGLVNFEVIVRGLSPG